MVSKPWAYVAIPLAIVVTLGVTATFLHTQRRKRLMKARLHYVGSNPGARRALERDLQEAWMRGAPQHEHQRQRRRGVRRWSRNANGGGRWAWAREFLGARSEEGLNEFGEAPPPYDGPRSDGKIEEEGGVVEMEVRPSGSGSGSGMQVGGGATEAEVERNQEASRTGQSSETRTHGLGPQTGISHQGPPPAYGEPLGERPGISSPIAEPPPVLVPGSGRSHPSA
jgi:hypothetical protein